MLHAREPEYRVRNHIRFTVIASLLSGYGRVCMAEVVPASVLGPHNTEITRKMLSVLEEVSTKKCCSLFLYCENQPSEERWDGYFCRAIWKHFYFCSVYQYLFWKQKTCFVRTIPFHTLFQDYWTVFRNIQTCLMPTICTCYILYAKLSHRL